MFSCATCSSQRPELVLISKLKGAKDADFYLRKVSLRNLLIFNLYLMILFLFFSFNQLAAQQPKTFGDKLSVYFSDTWNLVDTFALLAFVVAACLRFFDSTYEAARIIFSLNIIVFIVRSLQIVSVNRQLGPKLVMIRKMVRLCDLMVKLTDFFCFRGDGVRVVCLVNLVGRISLYGPLNSKVSLL